MSYFCAFCSKGFATHKGALTHVHNDKVCSAAWVATRHEVTLTTGQTIPAWAPAVTETPAAIVALPAGHPLRRLWAKAHPGFQA